MKSARLLAFVLSANVLMGSLVRDAHADSAAEEPGKDVPTLPAHAIKAPAAPGDFLVESHGWLRVVHHPSTFEEVKTLVAGANAHRASLATTLGQNVLENVELRIARTPEELATLSPLEARPDARVDAVAYPSLSLIVVSIRRREGAANEVDQSFHHQLAHLALFDATAGRPLPRWLQEGFAVHATGEARLQRAEVLFSAHVRRAFRPITALDSFPSEPAAARIAWAQSADFVRWLTRDAEGTRFAATIASTRGGEPLEGALAKAYGADPRALEQAWRDDVGTRNVTWPLAIGATAGWAIALLSIVRRRRRRAQAAAFEPEFVSAKGPRLIEADRGLGHVVYVVERKEVPKVEHDGKHHTLH